jgi:hypothetical protein
VWNIDDDTSDGDIFHYERAPFSIPELQIYLDVLPNDWEEVTYHIAVYEHFVSWLHHLHLDCERYILALTFFKIVVIHAVLISYSGYTLDQSVRTTRR